MACWLVLMLLGQLARPDGNTTKRSSFDDFPALSSFHGVPASPLLKTAGQRLFRTQIRDAAKQGPNFAGRYTIADWGCGTSCEQMVVVDAKTGAVYESPFGPLPRAVLTYGKALRYDRDANGNYIYDDLSYRLNSRLLIARGCPNDQNCGAYFFEWSGSQFKLLRRIPATPEPR
jgi:hypothetical protein